MGLGVDRVKLGWARVDPGGPGVGPGWTRVDSGGPGWATALVGIIQEAPQ